MLNVPSQQPNNLQQHPTFETLSAKPSQTTERKLITRELLLLKPEVLVLSASVGMGHVKAAEGCLECLKSEYIEEKSFHLDILKLLSKPVRNMFSNGYLALQAKAPMILGMLYAGTDTARANSNIAIRMERLLGYRLESILKETNPPIAITTHFMASRIIGALKAEGKVQSKLFQVVTDFDLHRSWLVPQTDHYFVAGRPAAERLQALGVSKEKISVTGIPISDEFLKLPDKKTARASVEISNDAPTILVTLGGAGRAPYAEVLSSLMKTNNPANIIVVCGKNQTAQQEIADKWTAEKIPNHLTLQVHGFTNKMHIFMAASDIILGKPGGLTMSEALATGLVPILIQPTPGQEDRNSDYLLEEGVAVRCRYLEQIHFSVDRLLSDTRALAERSLRSKLLGRPNASQEILRIAHQLSRGETKNATA